jgi:hypothetical protein
MPAVQSAEWGREVGRAGRKRKAGKRHPSGKLVQKRPDDKIRTSRQPHRRGLRTDMRLAEQAESPLGRVMLAGLLNRKGETDPKEKRPSDEARARYEAGMLYARVAIVYGAQLGVPVVSTPHPAVSDDSLPADGEDDRFARDPDFGCPVERFSHPDACRADPDNCSCRRRRERYDRAFEALMEIGPHTTRIVSRVAVHREAIDPKDIVYLVNGLDALARHWRLTAGLRRGSFQNAN